ncbi:PAS domain S-box protein [Massilia sp. PWRC2]|uniref:PAS domain S-box protein n=1 Tax=Massilia sp. PWRC2 TaxID=2804626 RepID=UPI003CF91EC0
MAAHRRRAPRRTGCSDAVTAVRANGVEFPAKVSISHFNLGHITCYTAIVSDITERLRIEGELLASKRRERERSQELSKRLFAMPAAVCIVHDRLLTAVSGNSLYGHWFVSGDLHAGHAFLRRAAGGVEMRDHEFGHIDADGKVASFDACMTRPGTTNGASLREIRQGMSIPSRSASKRATARASSRRVATAPHADR